MATKKEGLKKWAINRFLISFRNSDEKPIEDRIQADKRLDNLSTLAVIRSGLAGALSGMIISLVAFSLQTWENNGETEKLTVAIIVAISGVVATSIELLFLYRDSLSTAARMAKVLEIPDDELKDIE